MCMVLATKMGQGLKFKRWYNFTMDEFLSKILAMLKKLDIKPVIYGSCGVATYLGNFKKFEDVDILIDDEFLNDRWDEFKKFLKSNDFNLINEKERKFMLNNKKVGFASKNILLRDGIVDNFSQLIRFKNNDAFTLTPDGFLKAYKFSAMDGYRINKRGKKDQDIIKKLETYIAN